MTSIVGLAENGKVWIGGDSAGVAGLSMLVRADSKVFNNNGFVFGFTSSFRMGQLLRYRFKPPRRHPEDDPEKFMSTEFVDAVRACLKDYGYAKVENSQETGGVFLVGHSGQLFCVDNDYQVGVSIHPFHAVGCGADISLGVMLATSGTKMCPKTRILKALEAAQEFSAGVRGPFHIEMNEVTTPPNPKG